MKSLLIFSVIAVGMLTHMELTNRKDNEILSKCIQRMEDSHIREGMDPQKAKFFATTYFQRLYENGNMEYILESNRDIL